MRKGVCILVVFLTLTLGDIFSNGGRDESYSIRRAYIDVLGVFPTAEEIDWYCVYNELGYQLAVEWLIHSPKRLGQPTMSAQELKTKLLSDEYTNKAKSPLVKESLHKAIFYLIGEKYSSDPEKLREAKLKFISYAKLESNGELDVVDRMTYQLMSRTTNLKEANMILAYLRPRLESLPEDEAWLQTLDELLTFEDVCNK
jgi:hypothetical protein